MQLKYQRPLLWSLILVAAAVLIACGGGDKKTDGSKDAALETAATSAPATSPTPAATAAPAKSTSVPNVAIENIGLLDQKEVVSGPVPTDKFATTFPDKQAVQLMWLLSTTTPGSRSVWVEVQLSYKDIPVRREVMIAKLGQAGKLLKEDWMGLPLRIPGAPGDYQLKFTVLGANQSKTIAFKREGTAPVAKFVDAAVVTSTAEFCCSIQGTNATSFKASDGNIAAVFHVDTPGTQVLAQWKYQGQAIGEPQIVFADVRVESDRGQYIPFFDGYSSSGESGFGGSFSRTQHKAGDYELVLSIPGTSETRSLKFSLTAPTLELSRPKITDFTLSAQPKGAASTSFDAFGQINPNCVTGPGFAVGDSLAVIWKYQGVVVDSNSSWQVQREGNATFGFQRALATANGTRVLPLPAGEYEATCFALGAEDKTLKVTVGSDGVQPTATPRPATATPTSSPTPRPVTNIGTPQPGGTPFAVATKSPPILDKAPLATNATAFGQMLDVPGKVQVTVTGVLKNQDAAPALRAANSLNTPPKPDEQLLLISVKIKNTGTTSLELGQTSFRIAGSRGYLYYYFDFSCGVVPKVVPSIMAAGAEAEGNVCYKLPADEKDFVLAWIDKTLPGSANLTAATHYLTLE